MHPETPTPLSFEGVDRALRRYPHRGSAIVLTCPDRSLAEGLRDFLAGRGHEIAFVYRDGTPEAETRTGELNRQCDMLSSCRVHIVLVVDAPARLFGFPDLMSRSSTRGRPLVREDATASGS